jgi:hypothetical protein
MKTGDYRIAGIVVGEYQPFCSPANGAGSFWLQADARRWFLLE